ncbi:hypothetical protein HZC53_00730 [Candidatus Uhrbacteria bacterium]|nr:hypothetical protein [Candidatus Uhrbacteria bacterium]
MKIYLVTTNKYKIATARKNLAGSDISVQAVKMETPEIQALTGKDIASFSAQFAAETLEAPAMCTDAGMYIRALGGFPGPFIKFVNHWLTAKDLVRLMDGKKNRRIDIVEYLAYCEPGKKPKVFKATAPGTLAKEPSGKSENPIDELFIPTGHKQTLATMQEKAKRAFFANHLTHWQELARFIKKHQAT